MASVYPAKITLHSIPEIVQKHNLLVDMLGKDLSSVVQGGGVGDVKSPVFPGAIDNTVVLFDGTSGKRIKASTIYADWFDQSVATTADVAFSSVSAQSIILTQDTTDDERYYPYLLGAWHPDSGYAFAARATDANHYIEDALNMSGGAPTTLRDIDLATGVSHFPDLTAGSVIAETVNELTLTALATGFSVSGGDTSKTITVPDNATVSGTNTGDQDLSSYALKTNVLELNNTVAFTPDSNYEPATKKYVDDAISGDAHDPVTIATPANGLSLSAQELSLALASTSAVGALSSTDWNTFNGKQDALSANQIIDWTAESAGTIHSSNYTDNDTTYTAGSGLSLTGTQFANTDLGSAAVATHESTYDHSELHDEVTIGTPSNGLSLSGQALSIALSSSLATGALSSTDWSTFNGKQDALTADTDYLTPGTAASTYATPSIVDDAVYGVGWDTDTTHAASRNAIYAKIESLGGGHDPVTIGTPANGLSLSGQELSAALASTSATGVLSSTDWNTFNGKQDSLSANQIIDWTAASAGTIHASNYVDNDTTYVSSDFDHDSLTGFVANEHIDWTSAGAGTIHSTNYVDNDTTYTAGTGLSLVGTQFSNSDTGSGAVTTHESSYNHSDLHSPVTINATANGLSLSGQEVALGLASTSAIGALSNTDWNTFNGKQDALTFGIANTNAVKVDDASAATTEYARFTANGLEGRTAAQVREDINVLEGSATTPSTGWLTFPYSITYVSDNVFSVAFDIGQEFAVGTRITFSQGSPKYFTISAIGVHSGGVTPFTLDGGGTYTYTSDAILYNLVSYSMAYAPYAFPSVLAARAILAATKTVDGTGSGLDADTIDGVHFSEIGTSDYPFSTMPYVGTAPIVESGSTTDGSYAKYADGTMLCWLRAGVTATANNAYGALFITGAINQSYPETFYSAAAVFVSARRTGGATWASVLGETTTGFSYRIVSPITASSVDHIFCYVAVGRWKA